MSEMSSLPDYGEAIGRWMLRLIVNVDGEALILHTGNRPCVVTATQFVELAAERLSVGQLNTLIARVLPGSVQSALARTGSARFEFPPDAGLAGDQFTLIVTSRADEAWLEILRHRGKPATPELEGFSGG
jgi:hypothetical protein